MRYDCVLTCHPDADISDLLGDGICDDGTLGPALNCSAFEWDAGDCPHDDTGGPEDTGEPSDSGIPESVGPFDSNLLVNPGLETGDMKDIRVASISVRPSIA